MAENSITNEAYNAYKTYVYPSGRTHYQIYLTQPPFEETTHTSLDHMIMNPYTLEFEDIVKKLKAVEKPLKTKKCPIDNKNKMRKIFGDE